MKIAFLIIARCVPDFQRQNAETTALLLVYIRSTSSWQQSLSGG